MKNSYILLAGICFILVFNILDARLDGIPLVLNITLRILITISALIGMNESLRDNEAYAGMSLYVNFQFWAFLLVFVVYNPFVSETYFWDFGHYNEEGDYITSWIIIHLYILFGATWETYNVYVKEKRINFYKENTNKYYEQNFPDITLDTLHEIIKKTDSVNDLVISKEALPHENYIVKIKDKDKRILHLPNSYGNDYTSNNVYSSEQLRQHRIFLKSQIENKELKEKEAIETDPKYSSKFFSLAKEQEKKGDYASALKNYSKYSSLNPTYSVGYLKCADVQFKNSNFSDAISSYNKAENLGHKDSYIYRQRAKAKEALKDFEGAISDFSLALKVTPEVYNSYRERAIVKIKIGDIQSANSDLKVYERMKDESQQRLKKN